MRAVNLLPEGHRARKAGEGAHRGAAYVVVGVLASLLVMALVYTLTSNQASSRSSDAANAKQQADRLEARSRQLTPFGDFAQVKQTRLASVRQLAGTRFDWERFMRELARVLPSGSWLQETDASVTGALDTAAGGTATSGTPTATAGQGPKANLVGCTPHQSDVARMLVRLKEAHGVDDVQLNESAQEQSQGQVSVDSCGTLYKFDLTVSFATGAPQVPEGTRKVPASLGGGE